MTRLAALSALLALLAACGVDGPPRPPADEPDTRPEPGVAISGTVSFGVTGGSTRIRN
jgi:predicted small lipoprotein YifL